MTSHSWLLYSLLAVVMWGIWGVLIKSASLKYDWLQVYVASNIPLVMIIITIVMVEKPNILLYKHAFLLAALGGLVGTIGYICFVKAIQGGPASVVVPITAMYPAVTALLSKLVLGEELSVFRILGICLAVIAILLLSR